MCAFREFAVLRTKDLLICSLGKGIIHGFFLGPGGTTIALDNGGSDSVPLSVFVHGMLAQFSGRIVALVVLGPLFWVPIVVVHYNLSSPLHGRINVLQHDHGRSIQIPIEPEDGDGVLGFEGWHRILEQAGHKADSVLHKLGGSQVGEILLHRLHGCLPVLVFQQILQQFVVPQLFRGKPVEGIKDPKATFAARLAL